MIAGQPETKYQYASEHKYYILMFSDDHYDAKATNAQLADCSLRNCWLHIFWRGKGDNRAGSKKCLLIRSSVLALAIVLYSRCGLFGLREMEGLAVLLR